MGDGQMKRATLVLVALMVIALLLGGVGQATAAFIEVSQTADITGLAPNTSYSQTFSSPSSVSIAAGDDVHIRYTFLGGDIRLSNSTGGPWGGVGPWLQVSSPPGTYGNFTISNVSVQLLGFSGSPGTSSLFTRTTDTSGSAHIGPTQTSYSSVLPANSYVEFSGIDATYHVESLPASPNTYNGGWLVIWGSEVEAVAPSATAAPEPASLSLLGLGGLCLGGCVWRRRKAARLAA
jgi:hypothetical protein